MRLLLSLLCPIQPLQTIGSPERVGTRSYPTVPYLSSSGCGPGSSDKEECR